MVAVYLCETDESKIECMSFKFFNSILHQLDRKLHYDMAVGYAGNSFFSDSSKLIESSYPLRIAKEDQGSAYGEQLAALLNSGTIKIVKQEKEQDEYGISFGQGNPHRETEV